MISSATWRAPITQQPHRPPWPERKHLVRSDSKVHTAIAAAQDAGVPSVHQAEQHRQRAHAAARQQMVNVHFIINYTVAYGQQLMLLGSPAELGCWNPEQAVQMTWRQGDNWKAEVQFPVPAGSFAMQYKYAVVNGDCSFHAWQDGPNITLTLNPIPASKLETKQQQHQLQGYKVFDSWEQPQHTQHTLAIQVAMQANAAAGLEPSKNTSSCSNSSNNSSRSASNIVISTTSTGSSSSNGGSGESMRSSSNIGLDADSIPMASRAASVDLMNSSAEASGIYGCRNSTSASVSSGTVSSSSSSSRESMGNKLASDSTISWGDVARYAFEATVGAATVVVAIGTRLAEAAAAAASAATAAAAPDVADGTKSPNNRSSSSSNPVAALSSVQDAAATLLSRVLGWHAAFDTFKTPAVQSTDDSSSNRNKAEASRTGVVLGMATSSSSSKAGESSTATTTFAIKTARSRRSSSSVLLRQAQAVLLHKWRGLKTATADMRNPPKLAAALAVAENAAAAATTVLPQSSAGVQDGTSSAVADATNFSPPELVEPLLASISLEACSPAVEAETGTATAASALPATAAAQLAGTELNSSTAGADKASSAGGNTPVVTAVTAATASAAVPLAAAQASNSPNDVQTQPVAGKRLIAAEARLAASELADAQMTSSSADEQQSAAAAAAAMQSLDAQLASSEADIQSTTTSASESTVSTSAALKPALESVDQQQQRKTPFGLLMLNETASDTMQQLQTGQLELLAAAAAEILDTQVQQQQESFASPPDITSTAFGSQQQQRETAPPTAASVASPAATQPGQQDVRQQQRRTLLSEALANLQQQRQLQDVADPWKQQQQQHTAGPIFDGSHQVPYGSSYDVQQQQVLSGLLHALEVSSSLRLQYAGDPCDPYLLAADRRLAAAADVFRELTHDENALAQQQQQQQQQDQMWQEVHVSGW